VIFFAFAILLLLVVVVVAAQHKKGKREMGFYVFNQNFFFWRFDDFDSRFWDLSENFFLWDLWRFFILRFLWKLFWTKKRASCEIDCLLELCEIAWCWEIVEIPDSSMITKGGEFFTKEEEEEEREEEFSQARSCQVKKKVLHSFFGHEWMNDRGASNALLDLFFFFQSNLWIAWISWIHLSLGPCSDVPILQLSFCNCSKILGDL
jgi:hypothetical protein